MPTDDPPTPKDTPDFRLADTAPLPGRERSARVAAAPAVAPDGDRYLLRGVLGTGGMGEVQLCRDRVVGREVALKVLHPSRASDADAVGRFSREARLQGGLEHPAIVPVYDLGVTSDGRSFFTMKRVRGRTLAQVLDEARAGRSELSRRKLLSAFVQVALAIELAHARGVIHRDLKPSNVMLGDFGEVYVLDWGIARLQARDAFEPEAAEDDAAARAVLDPGLTIAGDVLGTPGYMAPEQDRGDSAAIDARADVYALGAILFELLTCHPLNPGASANERLALAAAGLDVAAAARRVGAELPVELEALCARATARDPAARLATAREVADAVERFLDGDRDLERRRRLADQHAEAAEALFQGASGGGAELQARQRALAELGQALGLEPFHTGARRLLVRLLSTAPTELPPEAAAAIARSATATQALGARAGVISYAIWLALIVPFGLWMGIENAWLFGLLFAAHAAALAGTAWAAGARTVGGVRVGAGVAASLLATGSLGLAFGPLVLVPTVTAAVMGTVLLGWHGRGRAAIVAASCALVVGPWLGAAAGLLPQWYSFDGGTMSITPLVVRFAAAPTQLTLGVASLATIVVLALAVGRIRDTVTAAERTLQLHAWHLRQLVGEEPTRLT